ncbi:hypothetical protein THAOC_01601, partial [Thalassiosira oceanica]
LRPVRAQRVEEAAHQVDQEGARDEGGAVRHGRRARRADGRARAGVGPAVREADPARPRGHLDRDVGRGEDRVQLRKPDFEHSHGRGGLLEGGRARRDLFLLEGMMVWLAAKWLFWPALGPQLDHQCLQTQMSKLRSIHRPASADKEISYFPLRRHTDGACKSGLQSVTIALIPTKTSGDDSPQLDHSCPCANLDLTAAAAYYILQICGGLRRHIATSCFGVCFEFQWSDHAHIAATSESKSCPVLARPHDIIATDCMAITMTADYSSPLNGCLFSSLIFNVDTGELIKAASSVTDSPLNAASSLAEPSALHEGLADFLGLQKCDKMTDDVDVGQGGVDDGHALTLTTGQECITEQNRPPIPILASAKAVDPAITDDFGLEVEHRSTSRKYAGNGTPPALPRRRVLGSVGLRWVLCKGPGEGQPASGEGPQGPEKGGGWYANAGRAVAHPELTFMARGRESEQRKRQSNTLEFKPPRTFEFTTASETRARRETRKATGQQSLSGLRSLHPGSQQHRQHGAIPSQPRGRGKEAQARSLAQRRIARRQ